MRRIAMKIAVALFIGVLGSRGTAAAQSAVDFTPSKTKITLKSVAAQVATLTQTINTLQGNITTLQGQFATANATIVSLQTQLTTANATIASLQTQLNSTSAQNAF